MHRPFFGLKCHFFVPFCDPYTGLLVDVFGDYKYLFFMCGSVIVTGGLFLFVMNIYNYHMLGKENTAKGIEQNQNNTENQDRVSVLEAETKQTRESETELTDPEAKETNGARQDPWSGEGKNTQLTNVISLCSMNVRSTCMCVYG